MWEVRPTTHQGLHKTWPERCRESASVLFQALAKLVSVVSPLSRERNFSSETSNRSTCLGQQNICQNRSLKVASLGHSKRHELALSDISHIDVHWPNDPPAEPSPSSTSMTAHSRSILPLFIFKRSHSMMSAALPLYDESIKPRHQIDIALQNLHDNVYQRNCCHDNRLHRFLTEIEWNILHQCIILAVRSYQDTNGTSLRDNIGGPIPHPVTKSTGNCGVPPHRLQ